jgi:putative transposase
VFADDADHIAFLESLAKTKERYPFRLLGYCLMTNHFHLLLRPESGQSISRILQSLTVAHTWRYHKRHQTSGHVWQGRFKSPAIQDDIHLLIALHYIEGNPLRAGMVTDLGDCRWSSFAHHGMGHEDPLLDPVPEWEELGRTPAERRRRWRAKLRADQDAAELASVRASLKTGRPLGEADWLERVANRLKVELNPRPRGRPPRAKIGSTGRKKL